MKTKTFSLVNLIMVFALLFSGGSRAAARAPDIAQVNSAQENAQLISSFGKLPLIFVQNQGQMDSRVAYSLQGQNTSIYFASDGLTFAQTEPITETTASSAATPRDLRSNPNKLENSLAKTSRWILKLEFVGANPGVVPQGEDKAETVVSYFKGDPNQWHTGLPTYHRLVYHELWPGIDLIYDGSVNQMKYEFIVSPGADPAQIRLTYRGISSLKLDSAGGMEISTPFGSLLDEAPIAYQDTGGVQKSVLAAYRVQDAGRQLTGVDAASAAGNVISYSFRVDAYDPTLPLVIDPAVLVYTGYIGGSDYDQGHGIAVDSSGAVYITGGTYSDETGFPITVEPDLNFSGGIDDAFVVKVRPDGSGLIYAGYIGGSGDDWGSSIAVDGNGAAYITGSTTSGESTFPVIGGPDLTYNGGDYGGDAFVAKVRPDGSGLVYCGYIGGSLDDLGYGVAVDGSGAAYVTGETNSDQTTFPVRGGPDLTYNGSYNDAFVVKLRPDGSGLVYAGYIGGSGRESGYSIAVDGSGAAYVTGNTNSNQASFPVSVGPDLTFNGSSGSSSDDGYVAKVRPDGSGLVYAGYIGGSGFDNGNSIAVDGSGAAYVTGYTESDQATFPVIGGPDLTFNGGNNDCFVAKLRPDGSGLVYAGYIGGSDDELGSGIAVDGSGAAYVTGFTFSDQSTFPVSGGPDLTYNGTGDAFVVKLRPDGSGLAYSGYIGGSEQDGGSGIAVDVSGAAYITGGTRSNQTTFPVVGGPDSTYNGGDNDAFVAKIMFSPSLPSLSINYSAGSPGSYFTITGMDYPSDQNAIVVVNGHVLTDTLAVDHLGSFVFLLNTSGADPGRYFVTTKVTNEVTTEFRLDITAPTRPQEGSGPILNVPIGTAYTHSIDLPLVKR